MSISKPYSFSLNPEIVNVFNNNIGYTSRSKVIEKLIQLYNEKKIRLDDRQTETNHKLTRPGGSSY